MSKGAGGDGIEFASVARGDLLGVVFDEDERTVTHFTLNVLVQVRQQHAVTLAE